MTSSEMCIRDSHNHEPHNHPKEHLLSFSPKQESHHGEEHHAHTCLLYTSIAIPRLRCLPYTRLLSMPGPSTSELLRTLDRKSVV